MTSFLRCLNAKTGYSTVNVKKLQNAGELIQLKRHPLPRILKLQNWLPDRRSEVLLSPVCNRETEAWQAWVTSTRSYMPVGVLGIKPRSFWHIETQAYISYCLGRLQMLSSPPLTVCATETAFVLPNLLPNVSNITSAVNCETRARSLWSTCPASMWLFLLAADPLILTICQFLYLWLACRVSLESLSSHFSLLETCRSLTLTMRTLVFLWFYQKFLILIITTTFTLC